MTEPLHMQITLSHPPDVIFRALIDTLPDWFAEFAEVSLAEKRYDFWGRYTPGAPDRAAGNHPLLEYVPAAKLAYGWKVGEVDTRVTYSLHPREGKQVMVVQQAGETAPNEYGFHASEDFWFLSLENLRRHLDGKPVTRCDFSAPMLGDIQHEIEIDAPREAVFETLIRPEQLNRWIASNAVVEAVPGGLYDLGWPQNSGAMKVLDITPPQKLVVGSPEGSGNAQVVTWTLAESGGKTRLTLVHSGFAPDADTSGLNTGWRNFMGWVRSLVEYGPSWQPPLIRLTADKEGFYAESISKGQQDLVQILP